MSIEYYETQDYSSASSAAAAFMRVPMETNPSPAAAFFSEDMGQRANPRGWDPKCRRAK
jgi:hypothetical protein